jgi:hypothetical protein
MTPHQGAGAEVVAQTCLPKTKLAGEVLVHLLFGVTPTSSSEKWTYLGKYIDSWDAFIKAIHSARKRFANNYEDVKEIYLNDASLGSQSSVREEFRKLSKSLGKSYATVVLPQDEPSPDDAPYAALALSGIPLVDTSSASWEQILELRKDPDARAKLRNLRLFFHNNYQGKPATFVVDDLGRRLDEYTATQLVVQPERQRLATLPARRSLSILLLAGKASTRRRPVNSALGTQRQTICPHRESCRRRYHYEWPLCH